jgi:hypothetical protein
MTHLFYLFLCGVNKAKLKPINHMAIHGFMILWKFLDSSVQQFIILMEKDCEISTR